MTISIDATMTTYHEISFEVEEWELEVMSAQGVDVTDTSAVGQFYLRHVGKGFTLENGERRWFAELAELATDADYTDGPEVNEWCAHGQAQDRFWLGGK